MSIELPIYPKRILRAGLAARSWPRGEYEFASESHYAKRMNDARTDGVRLYAEDNQIPFAVASAMLEVQIDDAKARVEAFKVEVWGV